MPSDGRFADASTSSTSEVFELHASPRGPIDATQFVWWHRLRRLGAWGFTALLGAVIAPVMTIVPYVGIVAWYGYPAWFIVEKGLLVLAITVPVYVSISLWTWRHMEARYRETLARRCPACGHEQHPAAERCPECGSPVNPAGAVPA